MSVSSRTPEGLPSRCPLCGASTNLEFSDPLGDAPCPGCGYLLWRSMQLLTALQSRLSQILGVAPEEIDADTDLIAAEARGDSLDTVELVMELEEEFDVELPDDAMEGINTVGDVIRAIERYRRGQEE